MKRIADFAVVGAGVVGASIAFGLVQHGYSVLLLDGVQTDPRASGANFGLVWVQGKGPGVPEYQDLTRVSSDIWPDFAKGTHSGERRARGDTCLRAQWRVELHIWRGRVSKPQESAAQDA